MRAMNPREPRMPDLRFVPVESLVPHERHDDQRMQPLAAKLREQGLLKNPPIVTPLSSADGSSEPRFVVLDGANRSTAAQAAGLPHLVVQGVRYEDVELTTWCHALADEPRPRFERALRDIDGLTLEETDPGRGRALLGRREALACVMFSDGAAVALEGGHDLHQRNRLLNAVVDLYRADKRFHRVPTDSIETARRRLPDATAVVVFPHFEPDEVLELATGDSRLPAGITRHLVPWRALRLNVPLERLADRATPLAEKNRWLKEWLRDKQSSRQVRFYEEPTVLYDE